MNLRDWLLSNNITQDIFAEKLDITRSHLSCIICKNRKTSKKVAKKIVKETEGLFSIEDVMTGICFGYEGKRKRVLAKQKGKTKEKTKEIIPILEKKVYNNSFSLL